MHWLWWFLVPCSLNWCSSLHWKKYLNVGVYVFDPQIRGYFLALSVFWIVCSIILNDWSGSPKRTNPSKKCIFRENFVFDSFCSFLVSSWCFHTSWSKRPIFLSQFFWGMGAVLQKICEVWNLPYWYCRVSTVHTSIFQFQKKARLNSNESLRLLQTP